MYTSKILDELDEIRREIEQLGKESIRWTVDDFLQQALQNESVFLPISMVDVNKHLKKYDSKKFQNALERMIDNHDASIGITWDTIDAYLDTDCLID